MSRNGLNILIVEDEVLLSMDLELVLKDMGHSVIGCVLSGEEALTVIEKRKPDIVLIDIKLDGDMDGIETSKIIIRDHDVPVIFMTGNTDRHTLDKAMELDPVDIIKKPIRDHELRTALSGRNGINSRSTGRHQPPPLM